MLAMRLLSAVIAITLVFWGCQDSDLTSSEPDIAPAISELSKISPQLVKQEHKDDFIKRSEVAGKSTLAFFAAVEEYGETNIEAIDRALDFYLTEVDDEYLYFAEQIVSHQMIWLLKKQCEGNDCSSARGKYVNKLVDSGFPDAALLEEEISLLSEFWTVEQIKLVKAQVVYNANTWLSEEDALRKEECDGDDCGVKQDAQQIATEQIRNAAFRIAQSIE